ncbi:MAG: acyl-CoA dehydrogenase family protein [Candidatus Binatia bacterium]|nr:acyl-CoA dehydrogenase family protein [Candidatus Binatia bacterium]
MAWDFETDPEFQAKLDWMDTFVREKVEPIDLAFPGSVAPFDRKNPTYKKITDPLKAEVREQKLWACHLGADLGGPGYGQVKLGLMNEILGRSGWAPNVFGCQAPDSGNAEILAHYGTEAQKKQYLQPLLDGEIVSCFSMTEPHAGADPKEFKCRAEQQGDEWVINGEKYFSSHADFADFIIAMVITDPDVPVYQGASMVLIPAGTPGVEIVRNVGVMGEPLGEGHHPHLRYNNVRVPAENILGGPGQAFAIAQTRLGGGRIHHAMRTVAQVKSALRMMCERALSRRTQGEQLARKQMVQERIADSFIELEQFRLLVMYAAWHIDQGNKKEARTYIAMVKVQMAKVLHDVVQRALHLHGALGCSNEMPLMRMWAGVPIMGIADGPTEVHKVTVAKAVLKEYEPYDGLWPNDFLPTRVEEARAQFAEFLEHEVGNQ